MPKLDLNKDYYGILELKQDATLEEIKKAYHKLAFKWHPDRNHGREQEAATKFQDVSSAYEILADPTIRAKYDADRAKLLFRNQPTPLTSPNNPYNPYNNFPPARPQNPRPEANPSAAGGNQYAQYTAQANAPWGNPANARSRTQAQDEWKAWYSMKNGGSMSSGRGYPPRQPSSAQPQPVPHRQARRSEQTPRQPIPPGFVPTPKARAGWSEPEDQWNDRSPLGQGRPAFGPGLARANTMKSPRRGGFEPGAPASGDEPSARNVSAYHHVRADSARDPARDPVRGSSPRNFVHPTAPLSADASRPRRESNMGFRTVASEESLGDRLSTPYATGGGEKTYFSRPNSLHQSQNEEHLSSDYSRSGRSPREQDPNRHRSASPRMKSPRVEDDTSSDASSEDEEDDLASRHKLRPKSFRTKQSRGPSPQPTPPPPPSSHKFDCPPQPGLTVENEFGRVHEFSKPIKRSTWNPETTDGQTQAQRVAAEEMNYRRTSTGNIPARKSPQPSPLHNGTNGAPDFASEPLEKPTGWQKQYGSPTDTSTQRRFEPPVSDPASSKSAATNGCDDSTDSTSSAKPPDDSYFQSQNWQEKFSHSGHNLFAPRNTTRTGSPTKGKPSSNMKVPRKLSIPRQQTAPRKAKGVSDPDSVPSMSSSTESISSGNAMDIDTATPPPKNGLAKPAAKGDSKDPLDMTDLKKTTPFTASNSAGLGDLNDIGTSLPFDSKASAAPPEDIRAQLPNPPKPPVMPNSSPLQSSDWERFLKQMNSYGTAWGLFYKEMLLHFAGRIHKIGPTMQEGWLSGLLTSSNENGLNDYIRWLDDDLRARQHWEVSIERHTKVLKEAEQIRQAAVANNLISY